MIIKITHCYNKDGEEITPNYKPNMPSLEELLDQVCARLEQQSKELCKAPQDN